MKRGWWSGSRCRPWVQTPAPHTTKKKKIDRRYGSSSRVPALQMEAVSSNLSPTKIKGMRPCLYKNVSPGPPAIGSPGASRAPRCLCVPAFYIASCSWQPSILGTHCPLSSPLSPASVTTCVQPQHIKNRHLQWAWHQLSNPWLCLCSSV
jgi:hypothetical protein